MRGEHALVAIGVVVVLLAVAPAAAVADCSTGNVTASDVHAFANAYNANTDQLPGVLRGRLANERVAVEVSGTNLSYTAVTDGNAKIVSVENGSVKPTLRVVATQQVVCDAASSPNAAQSLLADYNDGKIQVYGVGAVRGATVAIGKFVYGVGHSLGLW